MIYRLIFIGIICLAIVLRVVNLSQSPPGVTNDEIGYFSNAYSILKTGNDIYGRRYPIMFHFEGWPFLPIPVYIRVPIYYLMGLSVFSSRLPNIVAGVFGVIGVYFLVELLFQNKRLALLSSLLLAISPWHIQFSRSGYDGMLAATFFFIGVVLALHLYRKKKSFLVVAPLFF